MRSFEPLWKVTSPLMRPVPASRAPFSMVTLLLPVAEEVGEVFVTSKVPLLTMVLPL